MARAYRTSFLRDGYRLNLTLFPVCSIINGALGSSAMSMETHVFFRGKLPTKAALSRTMKELGFPFSIMPSTGSLERQSGFMPMKRRGEETGVELDVYSDHAAVEEFADAGVDAAFERRASLRWGGDFQEAVAGMSAAAALAKLMNGVVFDEAEDRLLSADDAIALARKNLQELVKPRGCQASGHAAGGSQALSQAAVEAAKRPRADRPPSRHPAGPAYHQGRILRPHQRQVPL